MENSYGFEISMSCVYNEDKGYDAGINLTTSDGGSANFECSADTLSEVVDKFYKEGFDEMMGKIVSYYNKPEELTPEQENEKLRKQIEKLTFENNKLRAQACNCKSYDSHKAKRDLNKNITYDDIDLLKFILGI